MMPILGKDWSPVLSINTVLLGLQVRYDHHTRVHSITQTTNATSFLLSQLIFLEPGIDNVQNAAAAEMLHTDPVQFKKNVRGSDECGASEVGKPSLSTQGSCGTVCGRLDPAVAVRRQVLWH